MVFPQLILSPLLSILLHPKRLGARQRCPLSTAHLGHVPISLGSDSPCLRFILGQTCLL